MWFLKFALNFLCHIEHDRKPQGILLFCIDIKSQEIHTWREREGGSEKGREGVREGVRGVK